MKIDQKTISEIISACKSTYMKFEVSHGIDHIERVEKLALYLAEKEGADKEIVRLAAWLHDLGYEGMTKQQMADEDHAEKSVSIAKRILKEKGFDAATSKRICDCVSEHRTHRLNENSSIEAKCIHDADKLDGVGIRGAIRLLSWDLTIEPKEGWSLNKYVSELKVGTKRKESALVTKTAKALAKKWNEDMEEMLSKYEKEINFK